MGGMTQIKFSHIYHKLLDSHNDAVDTATLLHVQIIELAETHPAFISYDTDDGKYKLPDKGKYLMLLFLKPHESYTTDKNIFTTLRRYTPEKYRYYMEQRGKVFNIIVESKEN